MDPNGTGLPAEQHAIRSYRDIAEEVAKENDPEKMIRLVQEMIAAFDRERAERCRMLGQVALTSMSEDSE
jgi:hypothetical protein